MAEDALDAIALLKADHREVEDLFAKAERVVSDTAKQELVKKICEALTVHAQIEEEIAYPAFRQAGVTSSIMDEAAAEHAEVKQLVEELRDSNAGDDDKYDAKVKQLLEAVNHHVKEEENEMFPEVTDAGVDIEKIGDQLMRRKGELMANNKDRPAA
jgi:hemerythrin superfamily protein